VNLVALAASQIIKGKILTPGVPPSTSSSDLPLPTGAAGDVNRYQQTRLETLADGGLLLAWGEAEGGDREDGSSSIKVKLAASGKEIEIATYPFPVAGELRYDILALRDGGFAVAS